MQQKTYLEKALGLQEGIYARFSGLNENEYVTKYKSASSFRNAYRKLFKNMFPRLSTPHEWRHTGAIELITRCRSIGLPDSEMVKQVRLFLGHSQGLVVGQAFQAYAQGTEIYNPLKNKVDQIAYFHMEYSNK